MKVVHVQATDAAATADLKAGLRGDSATFLQIQITVRDGNGDVAVPAAGTLTVKGKSLGAPVFIPLQNSPVDLTVQADWLLYVDKILVGDLEFTPTNLTANHTFEVVVSMGL